MSVELNYSIFFHKICVNIRLISPKLAKYFVRHNLQIFTMECTEAPRSSVRGFFHKGITLTRHIGVNAAPSKTCLSYQVKTCHVMKRNAHQVYTKTLHHWTWFTKHLKWKSPLIGQLKQKIFEIIFTDCWNLNYK